MPSVLIKDVRKTMRNHLELRMSRISLHGFFGTAAALLLADRAGMSQAMEYRIRKIVPANQPFECSGDNLPLHRSPFWQWHDDLLRRKVRKDPTEM